MRKSNFIYHLINAAIFILLEIAALNMLRNNGPLQDSWFSTGAQAVMGTVWGSTQNIKQYFSLKKSNDRLALENHELRTRIAALEAFISDSLRTASAGSDGLAGGFRHIPATVVKISNNTQHNYMIVGKGYADGVKVGCGVITGNGAVGVIDAVSRNFSYARSFKNHDMNISARLGRTGSAGPLSWDGRSRNGGILKEIPHHVAFSQGDTVYTSGYSSIFPADIPLGTAGESKVVNGATYEIEVKLFEDFGALRYVTVVENLGKDEMAQLEEKR